MTAQPGPAGPSDADLVARVLQADREAFATVYDRYGDRLYDFAYSMLRHREDAADAVADSFVLFAERLVQLRDPDRLRPWLYAIVRSECLRRLKARKRVAYGDEEQLVEMADDALTPDQAAEQAALRRLVWDAAAGLADRDRAILDLHLRQGLEGAELGEAMGVSAANAYVMLNRLRGQVDRSLGALLVARLGRDDCDELDGILGDWDGSFSPLIRKRVARHVDSCETCGERRKRMVSPWMLLAAVPLFTAPVTLRDRVVNDTQLVAHVGSGGPGGGSLAAGAPVATVAPRRRRLAAHGTLAAVVLLLLVLGGVVVAWPDSTNPTVPLQAEPSPTPSAPSPTPSTSSTPTTAPASPTEAASTPPATTAPVPGNLTVSTTAITLGRTATRGGVRLLNTGELPVTFQVAARDSWLSVSPETGEIAGGGAADVLVRADRSEVDEGPETGTIVVTWDRGSTAVRVSLTEERDPVVGRPVTPTDPSCEVPVTARVTDDSRLRSVRLTWTGPSGAGSATMTISDGLWRATAGTFQTGGLVTFQVTATDVRGNITTGPALRTNVNPCPG